MSKHQRKRDKANRKREREKIHDTMSRAKTLPCLLCGGRPYVVAVFFAYNQRRVFAPPGKARGITYSLCRSCNRLADFQARAERVLFADIARTAAAEGN